MKKISVLIPCYNEEITIAKVINDFKKVLPEALIYVYDNRSTDNTGMIAEKCGAIVKKEARPGKGNVIRSMFRDIDSDIYVMIDGDDTYNINNIEAMIKPILLDTADMVVGNRHKNDNYKKENKRKFHTFGNYLVIKVINTLFNADLKDIMSGYRVFNRKFVKNFGILSEGFEIETEMSLHALDKKYLIKEIPVMYKDRPEGSVSKLNTFKDGSKVLKTIFKLFKDYKPFLFFTIFSLLFMVLGLFVGLPVIVEFIKTEYITKVPSAVLATGLMIFSIILFSNGIIMDTIVKQHKEMYELWLNRK